MIRLDDIPYVEHTILVTENNYNTIAHLALRKDSYFFKNLFIEIITVDNTKLLIISEATLEEVKHELKSLICSPANVTEDIQGVLDMLNNHE